MTHSNIVDVINRIGRGESPGDLEFSILQPSSTLQGSYSATPLNQGQESTINV